MLDITRIFFSWQILLVAGCLLIIFPVIFLVSSLDKTPVKIKRVKVTGRGKPAAPPAVSRPRAEGEDDALPEPRRVDHRSKR